MGLGQQNIWGSVPWLQEPKIGRYGQKWVILLYFGICQFHEENMTLKL